MKTRTGKQGTVQDGQQGRVVGVLPTGETLIQLYLPLLLPESHLPEGPSDLAILQTEERMQSAFMGMAILTPTILDLMRTSMSISKNSTPATATTDGNRVDGQISLQKGHRRDEIRSVLQPNGSITHILKLRPPEPK